MSAAQVYHSNHSPEAKSPVEFVVVH
jgi:hypothetical protein